MLNMSGTEPAVALLAARYDLVPGGGGEVGRQYFASARLLHPSPSGIAWMNASSSSGGTRAASVNTLILRVDYGFQFTNRTGDGRQERSLEGAGAKNRRRLQAAQIRIIPLVNLLWSQSCNQCGKLLACIPSLMRLPK